jgi:hypothetical protein
MGSNPWVVNASSLILLGKTRHLHLLAVLADNVVVPQAVAKEVGAKPDGAVILAEVAGNPAYRGADSEPAPPEVLARCEGQVLTCAASALRGSCAARVRS